MTPILLKCDTDGPSLTVGEKKTLNCDLGHAVAPSGHPEFSLQVEGSPEKNQGFEIQFLGEANIKGSVVTQMYTSYRVGPHTLNQIKLKGIDENEYLISPITFEVKSVISGSPTPFPIAEPEGVPIPWWWWGIWGAVAFILLCVGLWQFLRLRKKRRAKLAEANVTKLTPREIFQAKIRKLESKGLHNKGEYKAFALELTNIIKKTIGEELSFAAEDLTSEELLSTLERRHKTYFTMAGNTIEKFLSDLDRIKFAKIESDAQACTDLLDRGARIGNALFGRIS